ncbi:hypothetical protein C1H46_035685 [Malus baccata]|uniref:Late embryogenesis abundant protein LEA-2 subgroup domain-containing protein n=1 Tax=Malus baccata TaxID=106549 RepID=A0A540KX06_MALBA|nr:hypothetical protein C1H46_035685 [Malus baccata]
MPLSLAPQPPNVQLNSLFMSKFNTSSTTLGANWEMSLTVENPNLVTWVRFNHVKGLISYKDYFVAISSVEPFELGLKESKMIRLKISSKMARSEEDYHRLGLPVVIMKWGLDEMLSRQREDGAVRFNLQMFVWATYKTGWWGGTTCCNEPSVFGYEAEWEAKLTFGNQNGGLIVTLNPFEIYAYYKESEALSLNPFEIYAYYKESEALSCASVDATLHIPPRKQKTVQIKFDSTGCEGEQPYVEDRVMKHLSEDKKKGYLSFSLKIHIDASYGMKELLGMGTQVALNPNCSGLKVELLGSKGTEGKINGGHKCSIPLPK